MLLKSMILGELAANCYVLGCGGSDCCVIDIGNSPERLLSFLDAGQLRLRAILLTHGHYDHVGGVEAVRRETGAAVYIHEADAVMLESGDANLSWQLTDKQYVPVTAYQTLTDGQVLHIGEREICIMHTPGHTPGGCCFLTEDMLFTGDTLFRGSVGRTDLGGNVTQLRSSLQRIAAIEGEYQVYPGHFESSTLTWEKQHNPYLRQL